MNKNRWKWTVCKKNWQSSFKPTAAAPLNKQTTSILLVLTHHNLLASRFFIVNTIRNPSKSRDCKCRVLVLVYISFIPFYLPSCNQNFPQGYALIYHNGGVYMDTDFLAIDMSSIIAAGLRPFCFRATTFGVEKKRGKYVEIAGTQTNYDKIWCFFLQVFMLILCHLDHSELPKSLGMVPCFWQQLNDVVLGLSHSRVRIAFLIMTSSDTLPSIKAFTKDSTLVWRWAWVKFGPWLGLGFEWSTWWKVMAVSRRTWSHPRFSSNFLAGKKGSKVMGAIWKAQKEQLGQRSWGSCLFFRCIRNLSR